MNDEKNVIAKSLEDNNEAINERKLTSISTGFSGLDYQWEGLNKGDTYLIAARPAMGKTAFILNMISHILIKEEKKVALFAPSQRKEDVVNRMLTQDFKVNRDSLHTENSINDRLVIDNTPSVDVDYLDTELSSEKMTGVEVVFIDYLQLMKAEHKEDSHQIEATYIGERIKQIAQKHNVAVVVLSQLSRTVESREDHRPLLSDFNEKEIVNYFDNVSFIYRDEYYNRGTENKGMAEIITAKSKYGSKGAINLAWDSENLRFCES